MELLMDPFLVTLPDRNADDEGVVNFLSRLGQWTRLVTDQEHRFWFSQPALVAIWDSGEYPRYDKLADLLFQAQVEVCDISIAARAFEILSSPPYLDEELVNYVPGIQELLPDEQHTLVIPEEISSRLNSQVADGLRQTLSRLAYSQQLQVLDLAEDLVFVTGDIRDGSTCVNVQGECYQAREDRMVEVNGTWPAATSPADLQEPEDLLDFWQDTEKAVDWAFQDLIKRRELDSATHKLPPRKQWVVGKHFNESIQENHLDRRMKLIEIFHAVVKVLIRYWGIPEHNHNHHLQKGAFQVRRPNDGALAWRAHVTNEPDRVRLHYWLVNEQEVELSNIVLKKDLHIEQD